MKSTTHEFSQFLSENFNKIFYNLFYLECYPDCKNSCCPAYYIKTYDSEPGKRIEAIQYYTDTLVSKFQKYQNSQSEEFIAMYIPSSNKDVFSNCGKVVSKVANAIPWMVDGTSSIARIESIDAAHTNNDIRNDNTRHEKTLNISMDITGRNIILFDDRCTSANSATQVINMLLNHGAKRVWFIALVLTDRRIFVVEQKMGENASHSPIAGRFRLDCNEYTFEANVYRPHETNFFFGGHINGKPNSFIRIHRKEDRFFGYLTMDKNEYKFNLSKYKYHDRSVLAGKITDILSDEQETNHTIEITSDNLPY